MNLVELTAVPAAALPVPDLRDHLRMGTGFADESSQDVLLESYLRAAISAIEARTGKVVLEKDFAWDLTRWSGAEGQGLPVGPVTAIQSVVLISQGGDQTVVDAGAYRLQEDLYRPMLLGTGLPAIPFGGTARINFTAGFSSAWEEVPADMAQAVLMLAASYYEHRGEAAGQASGFPFGVSALLERFRTVRLLGDRL